MDKRGYFFIIDAFIAIGVIVTGLLLIQSYHISSPYPTQTLYLSQDLMDLLAGTTLSEVNNPYVDQLRNSGVIKDSSRTLLEQVGIFYLYNQGSYNQLFVANITIGRVPPQYGYLLKVEQVLIYNTSEVPVNPSLLIATKKILIGVENKSIIFGPYGVEVQVWQR